MLSVLMRVVTLAAVCATLHVEHARGVHHHHMIEEFTCDREPVQLDPSLSQETTCHDWLYRLTECDLRVLFPNACGKGQCKEHVLPLATAMRMFDLDCRTRVASFMTEVSIISHGLLSSSDAFRLPAPMKRIGCKTSKALHRLFTHQFKTPCKATEFMFNKGYDKSVGDLPMSIKPLFVPVSDICSCGSEAELVHLSRQHAWYWIFSAWYFAEGAKRYGNEHCRGRDLLEMSDGIYPKPSVDEKEHKQEYDGAEDYRQQHNDLLWIAEQCDKEVLPENPLGLHCFLGVDVCMHGDLPEHTSIQHANEFQRIAAIVKSFAPQKSVAPTEYDRVKNEELLGDPRALELLEERQGTGKDALEEARALLERDRAFNAHRRRKSMKSKYGQYDEARPSEAGSWGGKFVWLALLALVGAIVYVYVRRQKNRVGHVGTLGAMSGMLPVEVARLVSLRVIAAIVYPIRRIRTLLLKPPKAKRSTSRLETPAEVLSLKSKFEPKMRNANKMHELFGAV